MKLIRNAVVLGHDTVIATFSDCWHAKFNVVFGWMFICLYHMCSVTGCHNVQYSVRYSTFHMLTIKHKFPKYKSVSIYAQL